MKCKFRHRMSKIIIADSASLTEDLRILRLLHPNGSICLFSDEGDGRFLELQLCEPSHYCSWFVDEKVISSNSYYIATSFDPRFLLLHYLEKNGRRYSPLDQIVTRDESHSALPLQHANTWKMEEICDVNDVIMEDVTFYRYNENKVLEWLAGKVERSSLILANQRQMSQSDGAAHFASHFDASAQSANDKNLQSKKLTLIGTREDVSQALLIVSEYISEDLLEKLTARLGLTMENLRKDTASALPQKRKADWELELEIEKETVAYNAVTSRAAIQTAESAAVIATHINSKSVSGGSKSNVNTKSKSQQPVTGKKSILNFFSKST